MICAMSQVRTDILPGAEWARFKAELDDPNMPHCPVCDCRHDYDGRPYCDTAKRFFAWMKARKQAAE